MKTPRPIAVHAAVVLIFVFVGNLLLLCLGIVVVLAAAPELRPKSDGMSLLFVALSLSLIAAAWFIKSDMRILRGAERTLAPQAFVAFLIGTVAALTVLLLSADAMDDRPSHSWLAQISSRAFAAGAIFVAANAAMLLVAGALLIVSQSHYRAWRKAGLPTRARTEDEA